MSDPHPFIQHLHAVAHNLLMATLLQARDEGYEVLDRHGDHPAAGKVREKLQSLDAAYAALSDTLRERV